MNKLDRDTRTIDIDHKYQSFICNHKISSKSRKEAGAQTMVQKSTFRIDLREIEGEGEFSCPLCGIIISPDDDSGTTYEIVRESLDKDGGLKDLTVTCRKCRSTIRIEGFAELKSYEEDEPFEEE